MDCKTTYPADMKSHASSNFSDEDDPPLKIVKLSKDHTVMEKENLFKFSQEKCEFCEKLCFCRYDLLVHNAKHIIIPLKDELVQCKECSQHFASAMDLNIHTKIHHFTVPDILKSLVITKPVVECDNSLTELVIQNNERKLEKIIHKKAVVECDSTVTELIADENMEKLKCFIIKQPIIRCEDTLKGILINDCNTQSEKIKENLLNLPFEITKKIDTEKLKTDLLNVPKVVLKSNNYSQNNVKDVKTQNPVTNLKSKEVMSQKNNIIVDPVANLKSKEVMTQKKNIMVENKANGVSSIKSRLRFEDDVSDFEDDIINTNVNGKIGNLKPTNDDICDLTLDDSDEDKKPSQMSTDLHSLPDPNKSTDSKLINQPLATISRFNLGPDVTAMTQEMEKFAPAVHYEDLTEPSVWECKRCHSSFLNRYDLIIHETKLHLQIKRGIVHQKVRVCYACERYIIGNHWTVRNHMKEKHPFYEDNKNKTLKNCTQCNLKYYRYLKHCNNHHLIYKCKICYKAFEQETLLADHILVCRGILPGYIEPQRNQTEQNPFKPELGVADRIGMQKIIKVCELCCLFFKNTQNYKYVQLRDYSEQGRRVACERCEKQFFEVKLIKLINRHPIVQRGYEYPKRAAPAHTNEQRLKKIQQRLKLMNKLC